MAIKLCKYDSITFPADSARPYLMMVGDKGSTNYINASFVDNVRMLCFIIACWVSSQFKQSCKRIMFMEIVKNIDTLHCFWKNTKFIIYPNYSHFYFPSKYNVL